MEGRKIQYIDQDGVMADFEEGSQRIFGVDSRIFNMPSESLSCKLHDQKMAFWERVGNW